MLAFFVKRCTATGCNSPASSAVGMYQLTARHVFARLSAAVSPAGVAFGEITTSSIEARSGSALSGLNRGKSGVKLENVIVDPGIALKKFPCCYASHRAMDGLLALRAWQVDLAYNLEGVRMLVQTVGHANARDMVFSARMVGFASLSQSRKREFLFSVGAKVLLHREGERDPWAQLIIALPTSATSRRWIRTPSTRRCN